ncbi:MAG: EAL domain-containing protein [Lachnospiraceae bacterium]|nr:EAL domain-containing protein [Lachnospiraceae bacterium]
MLKRTVLVVDDQSVNRKILGKILNDEYDVLYAVNGKEAMKQLTKHTDIISAVLLDIVMPVMDGYAVLEAMERDAKLSKIPVIVSSQKDGDEAEVYALSLGAQDFIAKPYKVDIIRHRLKNTIRLRETAAMINKAERDELTGLYNKQFFLEKVKDYLIQNPESSYDLLCFGIEQLKLISDTFGTAKGEGMLRYLANLLQEISGDIHLSGRFVNDTFYLVLPHQENYSNELFERWKEKLKKFPVDMDVKVYCGIYYIHDSSLPVSIMCDRAQMAAEKNRGKYDAYYTYYDDSLRQKLVEEQFITSTMQTALDQHQFQVYYQPKYDLNTEVIAGAEALVRWIHPEKGFLSPGAFIPLFETNGFITQLDKYVWERACQDIRSWMDMGLPPVSVSVNVSRADIYNPKLTDILLALVAKYQIPIQYLHLEITESAYTDNAEQIIAVVNKLRQLGFIIEMDDFGSGYSSLNMLADMPVDVLKLDMKFIQNESRKASGKGILSFVISLAKWLNLAVVAEGVETSQQIASLRSMDCNYVQGFYYAKPMPKRDFEVLLKTSRVTEMICTSRTVEQYVEIEPQEPVCQKEREILVVDDIEVNRAVLASTFMDEYTVIEAENGEQAWNYLEKYYDRIDVIMLDLLMPVMDGFQMLAKIRADERTRHMPVIIISQGDVNSEQRALEMQADDFISKPYKPDIIRHRVKNVIARYQLERIRTEYQESSEEAAEFGGTKEEKVHCYLKTLKPYFDIVRLVDPKRTIVYETDDGTECDLHSCYSVWGKTSRCNNCISLKAFEKGGRCNKLEYSKDGLYFVISEYVSYGEHGAVIEMVTKLDDEYVDNVFDKELLYFRLNKINQQLEYDELTGVYNRRHIDIYLERYVENGRKHKKDIGIAMIDIDFFKTLNDTYGHLTGDEALKCVAKILESNIALSKGDFVARFGGDEFIIVCRDISPQVFRRRIAAVSKLTRHIITEDGLAVDVKISAGCVNLSEFPDAASIELIRQADNRLYKAKQAGRNCIV